MRRFTVNVSIFLILIAFSYPEISEQSISEIESITVDNPIDIDGNLDFIDQAMNNSWVGNGTVENPYIIQDLE